MCVLLPVGFWFVRVGSLWVDIVGRYRRGEEEARGLIAAKEGKKREWSEADSVRITPSSQSQVGRLCRHA